MRPIARLYAQLFRSSDLQKAVHRFVERRHPNDQDTTLGALRRRTVRCQFRGEDHRTAETRRTKQKIINRAAYGTYPRDEP